ncbi:carbon storage regulator CsrA [Hathewaya massiliensis]|uniref:carbon storage regulator CsrA n=1 Tax=Hathewaya massiliensis TaxID=1964382 RepID=UPI0011584309|nr:carbon storage regulator CsrA [Hathewaya massiliensis]
MLVIKRKVGESLVIGENIEITVLASEGGAIKLGINAPKDLSILRSELIDEVKCENTNATDLKDLEVLKNLPISKEK